MRTKRTLAPQERRIFHPELKKCPHCGAPLELCGYWRWDKTVQTLEGVISAASRPKWSSSWVLFPILLQRDRQIPSPSGWIWRSSGSEGVQVALVSQQHSTGRPPRMVGSR